MSDTNERPPTEKSDDKPFNIISMVLHGMPPWQKSILTFLLMVPIALALSGLILQVNVGSIIQAIINEQLSRNREQTVGSIKTSLNQSMATLSEQIAGLQREASASAARLDKVEERTRDILTLFTTRIEKIEQKTDELTKAVNDIKIYICDTDQKQRGDCPLLK